MARTVVKSAHAPAAVGAYSQGIVATGTRTFYSSGQIALDPESGQIVGEGDAVAQAERVLENLSAVLAAAQMEFSNVVRATIYLVDMAHFAQVNEVYARYVGQPSPARACVAVAGLPRNALVEIDVVAVSDN